MTGIRQFFILQKYKIKYCKNEFQEKIKMLCFKLVHKIFHDFELKMSQCCFMPMIVGG